MGAILSRREFVRLSGAGLAGATLFSVVGCGGEETIGGGQGTAGGTFVFSQGVDAVSLDPINQADDTSSDVASHIFSTLLQYPREATDLVPALATEVPEPENGGRAYTFRLREGVRFHDGVPFDAQAVKFNFDRWRDSNNPYHKGGGAASSDFSLYALLFGGFDEESVIEAVEVPDEH